MRKGPGVLTRIGNADSNIPALKLAAIEGQSLLQAIQSGELCIAETLRLHLQFILDNSDIGAFASSKEVSDIGNRCIKGEVAKVDSIGRLVRQWEFLADRVACRARSALTEK